jgi:hypothetical protein
VPRTILLSPDPKPERILIVTLLIEGEDAFPEDEYVIGSNPPIEFDQFIRKASSIIVNQRTEVAFTSTKGFPCDGQYNIWVCKADDEKHRTEMTYELGVKKEAPSVELTAINASTSPDGAPSLPTITTGSARPSHPKSKPVVRLIPQAGAEEPPRPPEPMEKNTRNPPFARWMAIGATVGILMIAVFFFLNKKPVPQTKTVNTQAVAPDATSEPSAQFPTDLESAEVAEPNKNIKITTEENVLPTVQTPKTKVQKVVAQPATVVEKPQPMALPQTPPEPKPVMRSVTIEY